MSNVSNWTYESKCGCGIALPYVQDYMLRSRAGLSPQDTVACDLPELKLIEIHIGYLWTEEMISVADKYPNMYLGADVYAPKYWPQPLVHFINTRGQDKVLFGSDYPVLPFERLRREVEDLELRPKARQKFLRDNARRVFKL